MDKVKVTTEANGNVRFEGGTLAERFDATMEYMSRPGGAVEALKALIESQGITGVTLPTGNFCGTAAVHAYTEGR